MEKMKTTEEDERRSDAAVVIQTALRAKLQRRRQKEALQRLRENQALRWHLRQALTCVLIFAGASRPISVQSW